MTGDRITGSSFRGGFQTRPEQKQLESWSGKSKVKKTRNPKKIKNPNVQDRNPESAFQGKAEVEADGQVPSTQHQVLCLFHFPKVLPMF